LFWSLKRVAPDEDAAIKSPELILLTTSDAFDPIPPEIESGAGVFVDAPMFTPVSESEVSVVSPDPRDVRVSDPFDVVAIVESAPPPRLSVVESMDSVAAASIVVRFAALTVVRPDAERVVSLAAIVSVLSPESRVSVEPVEERVPAPVKARESISSTVPSIDMFPALPPSSIVIEPVEASTSNSLKLMAVAPPLIEVRLVPLSVVVPVRFTVSPVTVRRDPEAPFNGARVMLPVVAPPIVSVLFLRDWIVAGVPVSDIPLPSVVAEIVAVGVPLFTPVTANSALLVVCPPIAKSTVELRG
jgi:hypothetical protein